MFRSYYGYGTSPIFWYTAILINLSQSITNSWTAEKVMPYHISPNGSAGGCSSAYAVPRRHKLFNLHYFRPYLFWRYFKKSCLSHFPNKAQIFHHGLTTSTSVLKSHTGATQALTGVRESCLVCEESKFVHYYRFFSVFGLWHKANSARF